jgi:hypothetical protein
MFNLEEAITDWRQQMLAAGIKTPVPLEELESHLREEIGQQTAAGLDEQAAFNLAVRQTGCAEVLKTEFAKAGETIYERLKHIVYAIAGIPNHQLAMNMNASNQNLEPGWATYLKSAALAIPAVFIWVGSCIFVIPKLKEICMVAGTAFPRPVVLALNMSDLVKNNFILGSLAVLTALVLLEWRWPRWPRYRRMIFGIAAFMLNFIALALIATLLVFAVVAGSSLLNVK